MPILQCHHIGCEGTWRGLLVGQSSAVLWGCMYGCMCELGHLAQSGKGLRSRQYLCFRVLADEDTALQESNLPKVTWVLREGTRPGPAPRCPRFLQEPGAEKAAGSVGVQLGPTSPKQASLCRHV